MSLRFGPGPGAAAAVFTQLEAPGGFTSYDEALAVLEGALVTRARFPESSKLTLVLHNDRPPVKVDPGTEAGIFKGIG